MNFTLTCNIKSLTWNAFPATIPHAFWTWIDSTISAWFFKPIVSYYTTSAIVSCSTRAWRFDSVIMPWKLGSWWPVDYDRGFIVIISSMMMIVSVVIRVSIWISIWIVILWWRWWVWIRISLIWVSSSVRIVVRISWRILIRVRWITTILWINAPDNK